MNLYEIKNEIIKSLYEAIDDETGEIIDQEALAQLNALQIAKTEKEENIALYIKNLKADVEAYKAEKMSFAKRQEAAERKIEWLKNYLSESLAGEKLKTNRCEVSYRKSTSCDIIDDAIIPEQYLRVKTEPAKSDILNALKNGIEVPGCQLKESNSIVIK